MIKKTNSDRKVLSDFFSIKIPWNSNKKIGKFPRNFRESALLYPHKINQTYCAQKGKDKNDNSDNKSNRD